MSSPRLINIIKKPLDISGPEDSLPEFAHWAVVMVPSNGTWKDPDMLVEIIGKKDPSSTFRILSVVRHFKRGASLSEYLHSHKWTLKSEQGKTHLTDDDILEAADKINKEHPIYNLLHNNCQDFARYLVSAIRQPQSEGESEPSELVLQHLEHSQPQFASFSQLLEADGLPRVEKLLDLWVAYAYENELENSGL